MRKRLFLLRHAETVPDDEGGDHQRCLTARGRLDAPAMGREIARRGHVPALILCSSAARTVETLALAGPFLRPAPAERVENSLYLADARKILQQAAAIPDDIPSIMFIGHNPGLEDVARTLAGSSPSRARIAQSFPPTGFVAFETHEASWRAAVTAPWTVLDLVYPADL